MVKRTYNNFLRAMEILQNQAYMTQAAKKFQCLSGVKIPAFFFTILSFVYIA